MNTMNEHERWALETLLDNFSTRLGQDLRSSAEDEMLDDDQLSTAGQAWVQGYLTAQLSVIRNLTTGNPNVSGADIETIESLVHEHRDEIAAAMYA
jgi:hypothetical protein